MKHKQTYSWRRRFLALGLGVMVLLSSLGVQPESAEAASKAKKPDKSVADQYNQFRGKFTEIDDVASARLFFFGLFGGSFDSNVMFQNLADYTLPERGGADSNTVNQRLEDAK